MFIWKSYWTRVQLPPSPPEAQILQTLENKVYRILFFKKYAIKYAIGIAFVQKCRGDFNRPHFLYKYCKKMSNMVLSY